MKTLKFEVTINAPRSRVWNTMLEPETYRSGRRHFAKGLTTPVRGSRAPRFISSLLLATA
jgi:uncharacterized protein YndB with AHSA1/START domain